MVCLGVAGILACERPDDPRLLTLIEEHPVLTLISSSGVVADADSVCAEVFPADWVTYGPENLADRVTPEQLAAGNDWLKRAVAGLFGDAHEEAIATLQGRVEAYQEVMALGSYVESLATAVAHTPALADLLPSDLDFRAPDPMDVGDTLASSEHDQLRHALARRLGDMQPHERAAALRGLKGTVVWVESQRGVVDSVQ